MEGGIWDGENKVQRYITQIKNIIKTEIHWDANFTANDWLTHKENFVFLRHCHEYRLDDMTLSDYSELQQGYKLLCEFLKSYYEKNRHQFVLSKVKFAERDQHLDFVMQNLNDPNMGSSQTKEKIQDNIKITVDSSSIAVKQYLQILYRWLHIGQMRNKKVVIAKNLLIPPGHIPQKLNNRAHIKMLWKIIK